MSLLGGFSGWGCNFCDAHGPAQDDEEGIRLAQAHANACPGYLKNRRDEDIRAAALEMLALLRRIATEGSRSLGEDTVYIHESLWRDVRALLERLK